MIITFLKRIKFIHICLLITILTIAFFVTQKVDLSKAQTPPPFSFTAAGDFGFGSGFTAILGMIPQTNSAFTLALGDLSYSKTRPESEWCDLVKSYVGPNYPFQIVSGNHENDSVAIDGTYIDNYAACLPDHMNSVISPYGKFAREYYFDYQNVRVIMTSPNNADGAEPYVYSIGSTHYNWLQEKIREAKASGKWVVVGMHKNCISVGVKSCEIGTAITDLLINERVDLVLQGHDHNYQRSKQLTCASPNLFNPACTQDFESRGGTYVRGAGTTFIIVGTGGNGDYDVNASDVEAPYFSVFNGANTGTRNGLLKVTISSSQLSGEFVPTTAGTFMDSFVITEPGATPAPAPTLSALSGTLLADATIKQLSPTINYGTNGLLQADKDPVQDMLLKFAVAGVNGKTVHGAKLRLYNTDPSGIGGVFYKALDSNWIESGTGGVIWNNAPATDGTPLGGLSQVIAGNWYEMNVSSVVTGDGTFSFRVKSTSTDGASYNARESGASTSAQLILNLVEDGILPPSPSPTQVPTPSPLPASQLIIPVSEDASIKSSSPNSNYGALSTLEIDNSPIKHFLLKFPVTGIAGRTVTKAVIQITNTNSSPNGGDFYTTDSNWSENLLKWSNSPANGTFIRSVGRVTGKLTVPVIYNIDVTNIVSSDNIYSFRVSSTNADGADYISKEGTSGKGPKLIIDLQ